MKKRTLSYSNLVGNPNGFKFETVQPGAIINAGDLEVSEGQNLSLIGGGVLSTGSLTAPDGNISVMTVPGTSRVRLTQEGQLLSLEVELPTDNQGNLLAIEPLMLPELLTNGGVVEATGIAAADVEAEAGDIVVNQVTGYTATLSAEGDITLVPVGEGVAPSLVTTGDLNLLAKDTVLVRDNQTSPFLAQAGGNLYIQGNNGIDILALNHPETPFVSGGNLSLVSDGIISGDAHFASGGGFSILNLAGEAGTFRSINDPIISANGDVEFRDYTGASLKIEATGSIIGGEIIINNPDIGLAPNPNDPDVEILRNSPALILRAGLDTLLYAPNVPTSAEGTTFDPPGNPSFLTPGSIQIGDVNNSEQDRNGVTVILNATGNIQTGRLTTDNLVGDGGFVNLEAGGNISTGGISTIAGNMNGDGGEISLTAGGSITLTGDVLRSWSPQNGSDITFTATGDISINCTNTAFCVETFSGGIPGVESRGNSGNVTFISEEGSINAGEALINATNGTNNPGNVTISAKGNISLRDIATRLGANANTGVDGGSITIISETGSINIAANVNSANSSATNGNGGDITLEADRNIEVIDILANSNGGNGGNITIQAGGNLKSDDIHSFGALDGGDVNLTIGGTFDASGTDPADNTIGGILSCSSINDQCEQGNGTGGTITVNATDNIIIGFADASGQLGGGDINLTSTEGSIEIEFDVGSESSNGNGGNISLEAGENIQFTDASSTANTGNGGTIKIQAGGDLTFDDIGTLGFVNGGDINLTVGGTVDNSQKDPFNNTIGGILSCSSPNDQCTPGNGTGGSITLNVDGDILMGNINSSGILAGGEINLTSRDGSIDTSAGTINSSSENGASGAILLDAADEINTSEIDSSSTNGSGGKIDLSAGNQITISEAIRFGSTDKGGDSLTLNTPGEITLPETLSIGGADIVAGNINPLSNLVFSSDESLNTEGGSLSLTFADGFSLNNAISTTGGDLSVTGRGAIALQSPIDTDGGTITITGNTIDAIAATLDSSSTTGAGGNISLMAENNLLAGTLDASSTTSVGGDINLESQTGVVESGNLMATGETGGGDVTVTARDRIITQEINTSSLSGNGGTVKLDPENGIQVTLINAQGGTEGTGGTVDITTEQFFQATGTFTDQNNIIASISTAGSTAGGAGEGTITIRHDGGARGISFDVGNATINGTAGALTTSANNSILPFQSFPGPYSQGAISIITTLDFVQQFQDLLPQADPPSSLTVTLNSRGFPLEELFTREFEKYLGFFNPSISTLGQIRITLSNIESATGQKPALVYTVFYPTQITPNSGSLTNPIPQDNDQLQLVVVTPTGEPIFMPIPGATRATVLAEAQKLRRAITNPITRSTNRYLAPAQQLYQWIIAPIEDQLQTQGIQNLSFIMDGGLRSIPLLALHDGEQFLIEKYSAGLMPSISLTDTRYRDINDFQVLAMGASEFTDANPLKAVPVELAAITQELWQGESFLNQEFTLENLKQERQLQPFGIVHLATHGEFKSGRPENSYIQLWDTKLRLDQLRELKLYEPTVELLVLSACRTAVGDEEAELGFAGLAVQAGVKSALGSLWYVSDEATLGLMTEFYRQLETAPIKSEAL
ncbi:MAG: CHAT domain-containing protein [Coleofasciculus sp. D1-CHI-01]|uniref:CHAT domain-containing protein n=1 Tax=Coleofasciculus sp. D1-CHI-01 TaxID=3068482 RepID=UPI0032FBC50E